jgi:hypothetical protein
MMRPWKLLPKTVEDAGYFWKLLEIVGYLIHQSFVMHLPVGRLGTEHTRVG